MEENKEEVIIENSPVRKLPWEFSTAGMVVGFFFGFAPLLIALMGNYQFKKGYEANELRKAYKIIFIICIVLIALVILLYLLIGLVFIFSYGSNPNGHFRY